MQVSSNETDMMLLSSMAQGNHQALEQLYQMHGQRLLNFIIGQVGDRVLAEEILQNVMLAAWNAAPTFRGDSKVKTWLMAIAKNQSINALRKKRVTAAPLYEADAVSKTGPMEALLRKAERAEIREAILELPQEQRDTLELVFYHGMTGPEAAEVLGVSVGTIKSRLHRAKATLKHLLESEVKHD